MKSNAERISPATAFLGLYFIMMATDCFPIGNVGSLLRFFAAIPLMLLPLEYRNLKLHITPSVLLQLIFLLMAVVSLFYTVDIPLTEKSVLTLALNLMLVLCLGTLKSYSDREVSFLRKSLIIGSWITAILMIAFANISEGRLTLKLGESVQDANYINGYLLFAFAYHLNEFLENKKLLHLLAVSFFVVLILLTGSRGALLAFGLLVFVRLWVYIRESSGELKKWLYLFAILIFAVVVFDTSMMLLPDDIAARFNWSYLTSAKGTTGRIGIWKNLLAHYSNDNFGRIMFGHGYGTTRVINTYNAKVAHNLYLDILISLGMLGCVLQVLIQLSYGVLLVRIGDKYFIYVLIGLVGMCLSLSLTSYRPLWNLMLIALIVRNRCSNTECESELNVRRCE